VEDVRTEALELCCELLYSDIETLITSKCEMLGQILFMLGEYAGHLDEPMMSKAFELITSSKMKLLPLPAKVYSDIIASVYKLTVKAA
jgi:hypothetical protein